MPGTNSIIFVLVWYAGTVQTVIKYCTDFKTLVLCARTHFARVFTWRKAMAEGKYYWLKLKRDFFKRHDMQIIEGMPNGKDYILFYLKLLCESVDHDGNLRFSEQVPYNEQMLATITNTNVDIVRSAIKIFTDLGMMEILDNGTYFMAEVQKMIGSAADNDNANRQRRYREKQKSVNVIALRERYDSVTKSNESKSKSKSKSKNIFKAPTLEEVTAYCKERGNNVDPKAFFEYFTEGQWVDSKGNRVKNWKQKVITWEKFDKPFKQPPKNKFNNIPRSDYDMNNLEQQLLNKPIGE